MRLAGILAPIDFSDGSLSAARFALTLAKRHNGAVTLLHVDRIPDYARHMFEHAPADVWEEYLHTRSDALRVELDGFAHRLDAPVRSLLARDDVATAIVDRAAMERSNLIALGSRGANERVHEWFGSVAYEVASRAPCPVLVVRGDGTHPVPGGPFRHPLIAAAIDHSLEVPLELARAICVPDARFEVVHVAETAPLITEGVLGRALAAARERSRSELFSRVEQAIAPMRAIGQKVALQTIEAQSAASGLIAEIAGGGHDVVIVGQRAQARRSGVLGTVTRRLLEHAPISVAIA